MKHALYALALIASLNPSLVAQADGLADVEGARAHERQGSYLTRQEREKLRRYGGNDDGFYSGGYGEGYVEEYVPSAPFYGFNDPYSEYDYEDEEE